jgi:YebC/PmpR family DNA-binding regulatory protein
MAGHSHWAGIKHKKAAVDAKRGKLFSKLAKNITSAARIGGGDIDSNLKLKYAIEKARAANMPKDNIERAIKKGTGEIEGAALEEITYEGYGPGGVAIFVEVLTDNRNRTASEIRHIFDKRGGNMGETGCVAWMFEKKSVFQVDASRIDEDSALSLAMEAGAEDFHVESGYYEIVGSPTDFDSIRKALEGAELPTLLAEITYIPKSTVPLGASEGKKVLQLLDDFEEHEDVQNAYANFDIPEEVMSEMD